MKNILTRGYKKILQTVIGAILIIWLISTVNWREVLSLIQQARIDLVMLFIVLYITALAISAYKWQLLAVMKDFRKPYRFYLATYVSGTFLNNFFPSFIGGDTYRAIELGKPDKRTAAASQTVIADRITGLHIVLFLSSIGGLFFFTQLEDHKFIVFLIISIWIATISLTFLLFYFTHPLVQKVIHLLPSKIATYIENFSAFRKQKGIGKVYVYSTLFTIIGIAIENYVLFLAIGVTLPILPYLSIVFLISILASIPISIGNIGVKEWAYVLLFGLYGISTSAAVTVVLLTRLLQMLVSLLGVPAYFARNN